MSYSKGGHSLIRHVLYKGTTKGWWDMKYKAGAVGAEVASRLGPVIEKENAANRALNEKFQLENIRIKELEIEENNINANKIINELKIIHDSMNDINNTLKLSNEIQTNQLVNQLETNALLEGILVTEDSEKRRLSEIKEGLNWIIKAVNNPELYKRAQNKFLNAIEIDPDDIIVNYHLGQTYSMDIDTKNLQLSRKYYLDTIEIVESVDNSDVDLRKEFIYHVNFLAFKIFKLNDQNLNKLDNKLLKNVDDNKNLKLNKSKLLSHIKSHSDISYKFSLNNKLLIISYLNKLISESYYEQENISKAIEYAEISLQIISKIKSKDIEILTAQNSYRIWLAKCYSENNNIDNAVKVLNNILYKYPEHITYLIRDKSFHKKAFFDLIDSATKNIEDDADKILKIINDKYNYIEQFISSVNSNNNSLQYFKINFIDIFKDVIESKSTVAIKEIKRLYEKESALEVDFFYKDEENTIPNDTEIVILLENILFDLSTKYQKLVELDDNGKKMTELIESLKLKNEKINNVINNTSISNADINILKKALREIPPKILPIIKNLNYLDDIPKEDIGEYIINKTRVNSIKKYNTSLKMIFEEFIPNLIIEFPNIFDSSISSLLGYRSIFKKYIVDNNRNFLLSFLKG